MRGEHNYNLLTMTHRNVKTDKFKMLDHQINTRYNAFHKGVF